MTYNEHDYFSGSYPNGDICEHVIVTHDGKPYVCNITLGELYSLCSIPLQATPLEWTAQELERGLRHTGVKVIGETE